MAFAGTLKIILLQACNDSKAVTEDKSLLLLRPMPCFSFTVVTSVFAHLGPIKKDIEFEPEFDNTPYRHTCQHGSGCPALPRWRVGLLRPTASCKASISGKAAPASQMRRAATSLIGSGTCFPGKVPKRVLRMSE